MKKLSRILRFQEVTYRLEDESLDGLIKAVTKYLDTRTKAIFYTTYHNAKNIDNKLLRKLKINNEEVSYETIKKDYYPATMDIYVVIRKDTPSDSQTRRFVEYIRSKDGQAIIEQCGYVSLLK